MSGRWVYRDKDNHKCGKPPGGHDVKPGDIWECECGKMWVITEIKQKGDQRDYWWDVSVKVFNGPLPVQNR